MPHSQLLFFRLLLLSLLLLPAAAGAAVQVGRSGSPPVVIQDVYLRDGVAFVAIDEVLAALGLSGSWDNVAHLYRIDTPSGQAVISPGSSYLRLGERAVRVEHRPRFIDGKLRVSEAFLVDQFAPFLDLPLVLTNLNPAAPPPPESPLDQLFALLLRQRPKAADDSQWVVAIDPGHGGQDAGAMGKGGGTEQEINLAVALQLQRLLKMRRAAPVIMTRDGDYAVSRQQRLETVASRHADVLVSLHAQSFFSPDAQGVMLFIPGPGAISLVGGDAPPAPVAAAPAVNASLALAGALREALVADNFAVAPIQERNLLPLGQGDLPRVLVEMGSLTNPDDLTRLRDPARQQQLAKALYRGLEAFLKNYQNLQESTDVQPPPATQQ